jgi:hypothetical protein
MSASNPDVGLLSSYSFPDELSVDELLLRPPHEEDVEIIHPAFVDPAVGGEAGLPPFAPDLLRALLRTQLPQMRRRACRLDALLAARRRSPVTGKRLVVYLSGRGDRDLASVLER